MLGINMTPIKIPGKNKRDQRHSVIAASSNVSPPPAVAFQIFAYSDREKRADIQVQKRPRPPGRPPKQSVSDLSRDSTRASIETGVSAGRKSLQNLKSSRKMATLEKLPTEILTPIFLFSMNLGLPRASPVIAGKLSSRLTILDVVTNAFSPTWEYYYELVKSNCKAQARIPGEPKLQSEILRCKGATLSTLRHAEATWLNRRALEGVGKPLTSFPARAKYGSRIHNDVYARDHCWPIKISRWHFKTTDDCFAEDYTEFKQISGESLITDMSCDFRSRWVWMGFLEMHPEFDIPEGLLQGPWTSDMVAYLFWLIRAGARISWENSTNGEVAFLGLKTAIIAGNLQILYILHYLGLAHGVTLEMVEWATLNAGGNKVEVIIRLVRMFLNSIQERRGYPAPTHLDLAGILGRLRTMVQQQSEGSQDKFEVIAWMEALEIDLSFPSGPGKEIMAKG